MEYIKLEYSGNIATLTINRPKALNALNSALLSELSLALDEVSASDALPEK